MKKISILIILLATIIACNAETFTLDYVFHYTVKNRDATMLRDRSDPNNAYRIKFTIVDNNVKVAVSEVKINANGIATTIKRIKNISFNSTDTEVPLYETGDIINLGNRILLDKEQCALCLDISSGDIYSVQELLTGMYLYSQSDGKKWASRTQEYHQTQYDKLIAALKKLKWNKSGATTSTATTTTKNNTTTAMTPKSAEYTRLVNLFLHPLGLPEDIREINHLKFERFLKQKGYGYTKEPAEFSGGYFFIITNPSTINIAGVNLSLWISFDDDGNQVHYDTINLDYVQKERLRDIALDNAEKIASAFRNAGFKKKSSSHICSYEAFSVDDNDYIDICVDSLNDLSIVL